MRLRSPAGTRRSRSCSCAPPTSPSTCRTASSTAASPASTSCASVAPTCASCSRSGSGRAVSRLRCPRSRARSRLEDLAGASVATVYPRLARELLPVDVTLVDVTGSVEIAPRLGLADAIVDLVSSGNTLRTNGLRSLGVLLESEAVLVAGDPEVGEPFAAMLRAVVEARRHRYLMLNAPESSLCRRSPSSSRRACRACSRCRRPAWSPCTRSCRLRRSGGSCPSSRQPAPRRSSSCPSSGSQHDNRFRHQGARPGGRAGVGAEAGRRRAGARRRRPARSPARRCSSWPTAFAAGTSCSARPTSRSRSSPA